MENNFNLKVAFSTENFDIERIKINLSDTDKVNLLAANKLMKENKFIENIRINVGGEVEFIDDEKNVVDYEADVMQFIVYEDDFVFYAQHKMNAGNQIESEFVTIK